MSNWTKGFIGVAIASQVILFVILFGCKAGDAFYIADFNGAGDTITQATDEASLVDSNYVGTYYPWVKTIDGNTNKLTFPCSYNFMTLGKVATILVNEATSYKSEF